MGRALEYCRRSFDRYVANAAMHFTRLPQQLVVAFLAAAIALAARWAIDPWLGDRHEYISAYLAVGAVTWLATWRAGLLVTVLFFLAEEIWFGMPRSMADGTQLHDVLAMVSFWLSCGVLMLAVDRAARAHRALGHRVEELDEADHRKSDFIALLAHELRNPIAILTTGTELIKRGKLDQARQDRAWERLERQTARMKRLVDDLLDSARVEQGKLSLVRHSADIGPIVTQTVADADTFTAPRQQRIQLDMPTAPGSAIVDPQRVRQVLENLLHNASKFSPDSGVISVSVRSTPADVSIVVRDTGIGIPPAELRSIFGSFVQIDPGGSKHQGLGLGLALCRKLVEMHGGIIEARSAGKGRGSEFLVRLPREPGVIPADYAVPKPPPPGVCTSNTSPEAMSAEPM
jgi:signal transduction histidine kinase